MTRATVAVVTGANRGIGLGIVQSLAAHPPSTPFTLYATSRAGTDLGLTSAPDVTVRYPKLDIGSSASINTFVKQVKEESGSVDVLINNAGVNLDDKYNAENARKILEVNYWGTRNMCESFLSMISKGGRIVNVSSIGSQLKPYNRTIQERFSNPAITFKEVDELAEEFLSSVKSKSESESGFGGPGRSYSVSKACLNATTVALARENPDLTINCCCPGWVKTEMGAMVGSALKEPEDAAKIPIKLGFGKLGGVSGQYWANPSMGSTADGQVQSWAVKAN